MSAPVLATPSAPAPPPVSVPATRPAPPPTPAPRPQHSLGDDALLRQIHVPEDLLRARLASRSDRTVQPGARILGPFFAPSSSDVLKAHQAVRARTTSLPPLAPNRPELPFEPEENPFRRTQHDTERPAPSGLEPNATTALLRRQTPEEEECFVGNQVLSCYPTSDTQVAQDTWSEFIWNQNYPLFRQNGAVDVYLFRQDTDTVQASWLSKNNNLGRLAFSPNDDWWQDMPASDSLTPGTNQSWAFYFVITQAGQGLSESYSRLSTWSAIQTALPSSYVSSRSSASAASMSLVSAASASASLASASSASLASLSLLSSLSASAASAHMSLSTSTGLTTISGSLSTVTSVIPVPRTSGLPANGTSAFTGASLTSWESSVISSMSTAIIGSLRSSGLSGNQTSAATLTTSVPGGSQVTLTATAEADGKGLNAPTSHHLALPVYAIVLISVFGTLALLLALGMVYLFSRWWGRHKAGPTPTSTAMGSSDSDAPMMRDAENQPATGTPTPSDAPHSMANAPAGRLAAASGAMVGGAGTAESSKHPRPSATDADRSTSMSASPDGGITSDDATRMAEAFRAALRQPDFPSLSSAGVVGGTVGAAGTAGQTSSSPVSAKGQETPATRSDVPHSTRNPPPISTSVGSHKLQGSDASSPFSRLTIAPHSASVAHSAEVTAPALLASELASEGRAVREVERGRLDVARDP